MANDVCEIALMRGPLRTEMAAEDAGAIVDFFGNVRSLENGEPISGIEYEAHAAMAESQMRNIAQEAAARFDLLSVKLHHAYGFIATGQTSLFLRVTAAHRGEAFAASQWIVDELKKRVPIWKRPVFVRKKEFAAEAAAPTT